MTPNSAAPSTAKRRRPLLAYIVGGGMLLLGGYGAVRGLEWSLALLLVAAGCMVLVATGRPLYRAAVYRTDAHEILCRAVPWYEAIYVAMSLLLPIGVAAIVQAGEPGSPFWLRIGGCFLLLLCFVSALSGLLAWNVNRLVISPSALSVKIVFRQKQDIARGNVAAIIPRAGRNSATGAPRLHVDIAYTPADTGNGSTSTISQLDGQFTVDPAYLAAALQDWKDSDPGDPGLMDRVEALLRGRAANGD